MTIYNDYSRAKVGFFFGMSGWQLGTVALTLLPVFWSIQRQSWGSAVIFMMVWAVISAIVVVPVRGRSATGWFTAMTRYTVGGLSGRTRFRARAARGQATDLAQADLPGALNAVEIHDGPPTGPAQTRIAIIQNHATKTWAVTAAVVHPGIGLAGVDERRRLGTGLSDVLDLCSRTELIDELLFIVRTVPDDGAERGQWMTTHRRPQGPELSRRVNNDMHTALARASVRTEAYVTMVVPETRIAKEAKEAGGGLEGRARVLYLLMGELESQLRGGVGMTSVTWLSSPELAAACRTGFAPAERAGIIEALAAQASDSAVNADVPWAMAGPSGADQLVRHYSHDAWNSVSATLKLPVKGALMGALAPILTPTEMGERRSFVASFPILRQSTADRQSASGEWAADLGEALRDKAKVKQRTKARDEADKVRALDRKLARGNSMTHPYAVCTVTVPKTQRIAEYGRRLDASIRRAGFAPLRLDLSQDVGFAASTVPLGVSLTRGTN
ncbi:hypothetical protein GCM10022234_21900 [Aeromicrobium panaciterrae]|uniref:SCO6880 family protein n=1 Tax=Aeromicrobium panaciterrae TaxID=363861 RepID=UPI0031D8A1DA